MRFLNQYNKQIVKYDLINKFNYKTVLTIPELEYIILNFNLKKSDTKLLISLLSSLKLISLKNPKITTSKTSNIVFKIRKGQPVGCQLTLRNFTMYKFLLRLINKTVPFKKTYKVTNSLYSLTLKNILIFNELEQNYQFFKNLPNLNVYIKFKHCTVKEFCYLLKSYKLLI